MHDFHTLAFSALNQAAEFFESEWPNADVDLQEDALTITLSSGKQYLINKHGVTEQIWLSSPFTGAHHFAYHEGSWECTRTGKSFEDILQGERKIYAA